MRKLNKRQKKLCDEWLKANPDAPYQVTDDLDYDLLKRCEASNNYETINQDIARYLNDLISKKIYGGVKYGTKNRRDCK